MLAAENEDLHIIIQQVSYQSWEYRPSVDRIRKMLTAENEDLHINIQHVSYLRIVHIGHCPILFVRDERQRIGVETFLSRNLTMCNRASIHFEVPFI